MNNNMPRISHQARGLFLLIAGIILFLYVTNIITRGLQVVILLSALALIIIGLIELDAYNKVMRLVNKQRR